MPPRGLDSLATLLGRVAEPKGYPRGVIFLIGSARSGTTMLTDLFRQVPTVAVWPSEANDLWHPTLYPFRASNLDVPPYLVDGRAYTEASLDTWPADQGRRITRSLGWFQRLARRERLMVKSVLVSFMLPRLVECFPDARFIQILRDPFAVAVSQTVKDRAKLEHPRYAPYDIPNDDVGRLALYAKHWGEEVETIRADVTKLGLGPERYRELSYDALCTNAAEEMANLLEWLAIPALPEQRLQEMTAHVALRVPDGEPPAELEAMFEELRGLRSHA